MFSRTKKRGQSTLEYILVFTAIVGAIILVSTKFGDKVGKSLENAAGKMETSVDKLKFP